MQKMYFKAVTHSLVVVCATFASASEPYPFPHFRHIDRAVDVSGPAGVSVLTLLADEDFAPFSFKTVDGKLTGVSVQMALAACADLKITCQVKAMPYSQLLTALSEKQGDLIVGGPILKASDAAKFQHTRPYFYSMSNFIGRTGTGLLKTDAKSLAGRRLGFIKGSEQDVFLKKNYDRSVLVDFASEAALFEALRTGSLDVAFADSIHAGFWMHGSAARNCCVALGAPYVDRSGFSHALSFIVAADRVSLRDDFDNALDHLQDKGISNKIFSTFLTSLPF